MTPFERELLQLLAEVFAAVIDTVGVDNATMRPLWERWQAMTRREAEKEG